MQPQRHQCCFKGRYIAEVFLANHMANLLIQISLTFAKLGINFGRRNRGTIFHIHLEGLHMEDVEAVTGLAKDEIKGNLRVARKKIRQELERYGKVR